tara:strand:- start:152 stop:448 length:297 start_codon:yes stop_codon:yes gene_type:complete
VEVGEVLFFPPFHLAVVAVVVVLVEALVVLVEALEVLVVILVAQEMLVVIPHRKGTLAQVKAALETVLMGCMAVEAVVALVLEETGALELEALVLLTR